MERGIVVRDSGIVYLIEDLRLQIESLPIESLPIADCQLPIADLGKAHRYPISNKQQNPSCN